MKHQIYIIDFIVNQSINSDHIAWEIVIGYVFLSVY